MRIVQDVRHGVSVQLLAAEVADLVQGLVARECMENLSRTLDPSMSNEVLYYHKRCVSQCKHTAFASN